MSCNKKREEPLKINLCDSSHCKQYLGIWKKILLEKNSLSEDYFNAHIVPIGSEILTWNSGESFSISYQIKIDWMVCNCSDKFLIKTNPGETLYPTLDIRRGDYLNEDEIKKVLNMKAFSSRMNVIKSIEHLVFGSKVDAVKNMESSAGVNKISNIKFFIDGLSTNTIAPGEPFMTGSAELSKKDNSCIFATLNLAGGKCDVTHGVCRIQ